MRGEERLVHAAVVRLEGRERSRPLWCPLVSMSSEPTDDDGHDFEVRTSLTVPSQEHEMNWSFCMLDQSTQKTSRVCSCHTRIGRS